MHEAFHTKLRAVRLRCNLNVLLEQLARALIVVGVVVALTVLLQRALSVMELDAPLIALIAAGAVVVATLSLWLAKRLSPMHAAIEADERMGLKARFSTALALADSDNPFARAAVMETHQVAGKVVVGKHFPIRLSRSWGFASTTWVIVAAVCFWMPSLDLLGYLGRERDAEKKNQQLAQAKVQVKDALTTVSAVVRRIDNAELAKDLAELDKFKPGLNGEDLRRQAIRKLGDLSQKLQQMKAGEKLQSAEMMARMLKHLRPSGQGGLQELNRALAKGDFKRAGQIVAGLQKRLEKGKLSDEEKEAAKNQLADLARQLDKLAGEKKDGAGRRASERLGKLAEAAGRCAAGDLSQEELDELLQELDELQSLKDELASCDASLAELEDAIARLGEGKGGGYGPWAAGDSSDFGSGTGGAGKGYGAREEDKSGQTASKTTKLKNQKRSGEIIASWYFKGPQVKGEAKRDLAEVVQASKDRAAEAINENRIPKKYEAAVKKYFGELEQSDEGESKELNEESDDL